MIHEEEIPFMNHTAEKYTYPNRRCELRQVRDARNVCDALESLWPGDWVCVDRSRWPELHELAAAEVDGRLIIGRLLQTPLRLAPLNQKYEPEEIDGSALLGPVVFFCRLF